MRKELDIWISSIKEKRISANKVALAWAFAFCFQPVLTYFSGKRKGDFWKWYDTCIRIDCWVEHFDVEAYRPSD
jgi:hypothetical protein